MQQFEPREAASFDIGAIMGALYGEGITALAGAFPLEWADRLHHDVMAEYASARARPSGAIPRGPERFYVETHPERITGFADIIAHPWFVAVCAAVLGPDYRIIELGFDIPFPGAQDQPWHRDFAMPLQTREGRRLNSLAFNLTTVDTRPDHGPFEIAPGTQWDALPDARDGMFPPEDQWPRFIDRAVAKLPQRGDMSARTALTVHRGTANRSNEPRPVLIVGVDTPDQGNAGRHRMQVTADYLAALQPVARKHLHCRIVEQLGVIEQRHMIEGLLSSSA